MGRETTKYSKYSKKRYAQHCMWRWKPQNTQNTQKKDCMWERGEDLWVVWGEMWGFRSPTPRGRSESCTLRILTDALTGAYRKRTAYGDLLLRWPFPTDVVWLIHAGRGSAGRRSRIPLSGAAGCGVTLHHLTTLSPLSSPVSTKGASAGCEACRTHPLHSGRGLRYRQPPHSPLHSGRGLR